MNSALGRYRAIEGTTRWNHIDGGVLHFVRFELVGLDRGAHADVGSFWMRVERQTFDTMPWGEVFDVTVKKAAEQPA